MNRRDFLKSLLSIGATVALPPGVSIVDAQDEIIDAAWSQAKAEPYFFYVREFGTLTTDPTYDSWPSSRAELYGLTGPSCLDDVRRLASDSLSVQGMIDDALYEAEVRATELLTDEQSQELVERVQAWLDGSPDDYDSEYMTSSGQNGQGSALIYFRDEFEYCDEFRIVIVEGDYPGSSYLGAELRMPVEAANDLANELGIPIRFAWLGF